MSITETIENYLSEGSMNGVLADSIKIDKDIKKIDKMTDNNDHNGAALAVAELMQRVGGKKYKTDVDVLKHIQSIHKIYGSMPSELIKLRSTIVNSLLKQSSKHMTQSQADKLHGSL